MLEGFTSSNNENNEFHQRVADQNIQSIEDRQEEIRHAKNGFIGMLAGIVVGGVVGWIFLGPTETISKTKEIPIIRRPIVAAKVLPNDPGGMEIDNQDREIYHIVDNTPKVIEDVKIRPTPDMPKLEIKNTINPSEEMQNLVESIDNDTSLNQENTEEDGFEENNIRVASNELEGIKTNSREKIIIPEKIKDIEVKLQNSINSQANKVAEATETKEVKETNNIATSVQEKHFEKGTWYTQIIASSSRKAVQSLWNNLSAKHQFLKKYPYEIEEIKTSQGSVLYRLKVGSFKDRNGAVELSEILKKKQISCIIKQN